MPDRNLVADKLLWETLERWKRSSPELDRIKFLKTVAFFDELSDRQLVEMRRENHTMTLATLEKGAFFGEMALLDGAPRSANVRSLEQTHTLSLYRNDLSQLIERDPRTACQIYRALAHIVGDRLRSTNQLIKAEMSTGKAQQTRRIAANIAKLPALLKK
jgi:CRP-like cAMP-binding protein